MPNNIKIKDLSKEISLKEFHDERFNELCEIKYFASQAQYYLSELVERIKNLESI